MSTDTRANATENSPGIPISVSTKRAIPVVALGMALSVFFVISYVLCILLYLVWPEMAGNHAMLTLFLPWFELLNWQSFLLGLIESFGYGWYVALIFAPIYNFFAVR